MAEQKQRDSAVFKYEHSRWKNWQLEGWKPRLIEDKDKVLKDLVLWYREDKKTGRYDVRIDVPVLVQQYPKNVPSSWPRDLAFLRDVFEVLPRATNAEQFFKAVLSPMVRDGKLTDPGFLAQSAKNPDPGASATGGWPTGHPPDPKPLASTRNVKVEQKVAVQEQKRSISKDVQKEAVRAVQQEARQGLSGSGALAPVVETKYNEKTQQLAISAPGGKWHLVNVLNDLSRIPAVSREARLRYPVYHTSKFRVEVEFAPDNLNHPKQPHYIVETPTIGQVCSNELEADCAVLQQYADNVSTGLSDLRPNEFTEVFQL